MCRSQKDTLIATYSPYRHRTITNQCGFVLFLPPPASSFFFLNDTAPPELYPLPLPAPLPISLGDEVQPAAPLAPAGHREIDPLERGGAALQIGLAHFDGVLEVALQGVGAPADALALLGLEADRKSTRLNSSHLVISYAVFCLK